MLEEELMTNFNDQPYTPGIVRKLLEVLPELDACARGGMLQLNLRPTRRKTLEEKLDAEATQSLAPRPSRRSNTVYQIDNVAALLIDLERAITNSLNDYQKRLLGRRFMQGFSKLEVARMDNVSVGTVKYNTRVAIQQIVDYLETPKQPTSFKRYMGATYSHTRTYASAGIAL